MAAEQMQTDEAPAVAPAADAAAAAAPAEPPKVQDSLKNIVALLEKSVKLKDTRMLGGRLLRQTAAARKQLTADAIADFLAAALPAGSESRGFLESRVQQVQPRRAHVAGLGGAT